MAHKSQDSDMGEESSELDDFLAMERRKMMAVLGTGAVGGLAGCGGDGGGTPTATPTPTEASMGTATPTPTEGTGMETDTPTDTPGGGTGGDTETETETDTETETPGGASITRYDVTINTPGPGPAPPDAQFQAYNSTSRPSWPSVLNFGLAGKSDWLTEIVPVLLESWEYRPGVFDLTLKDDFYFWDGHNIDADTVMFDMELRDFMSGGEDLKSNPDIVKREKTDEYSFRWALSDTWSEQWAVRKVISAYGQLRGSPNYYRSWVEKFRDTSSYSAVEEIRTQLTSQVTSKDPNPFYYNPFKITDTTPDTYKFALRTRDHLDSNGFDHEIPRYVDEINYTSVHLTPGATPEVEAQWFREGTQPWNQLHNFSLEELDVDFETTKFQVVQSRSPLAVYFNANLSPMSSPRFRRAWAYMLNRKVGASGNPKRLQVPNRRVTPFPKSSQEDVWVSDDILANLENYGWDQAMKKKAEQEMIRGGFVRDSNGNWLYKEGDRAGQPMEFTYGIFSFQGKGTFPSKKFDKNMKEFGINTEFKLKPTGAHWGNLGSGDYEIDLGYFGSSSLISAISFVLGQPGAGGGGSGGIPTIPPTVEAPPVGETNNWADARAYEVQSMVDRLKFLTDKDRFQEVVDQLVWVYNQIVPTLQVYIRGSSAAYNTEYYDIQMPDDVPEKWVTWAWRGDWDTGKVKWIPEDER